MMTKRKLVRKKLTQYNYGGQKLKYAAGGASQYDNNTTSAAGQGNPSTTIIATEANPEVLKQREDAFQALKDNEQGNLQTAADEIQNVKAQGEVNIAEAAANANSKVEGYAGIAQQGAKLLNSVKPDGVLSKAPVKTAPTINKMPTITAQPIKSAVPSMPNIPTSTTPGVSPRITPATVPTVPSTAPITGTVPTKMPTLGPKALAVKTPSMAPVTAEMPKVAGAGFKAADATIDGVGKAEGVGAAIKAYKAQRATNQAIKGGAAMSSAGSAAGAGWSALGSAGQANVIGLAASALGSGIKKWSDDDDATTVNAGEGIGAGVAGAGAGIGAVATAGALMGSAVPVLGTAIGAAAGALYGVGKSIFARNKARKAERKMEKEVKERKTKYNKELGENYAQQKGMLVGMQNRMKETSGYDVGNVSVARFGGQRLKRS